MAERRAHQRKRKASKVQIDPSLPDDDDEGKEEEDEEDEEIDQVETLTPKKKKDEKSPEKKLESPAPSLARQGTWAKSFKVRGQARTDDWEKPTPLPPSIASSPAHGIRRIWLIRHAQSEGNADKKLLNAVADHALKLSKEGVEQAKEAAKRLKVIRRVFTI